MLELMFAAALMDTIVAPPETQTVYVHEWGVITFMQDEITLGADPMEEYQGYPFSDQQGDMVVRAPVVYFYGEPFTGSLSVTVNSGYFIDMYPGLDPDMISSIGSMAPSQSATWELSTFPGAGERDLPYGLHFLSDEMLDAWRVPEAMTMEFGCGTMEKFLYYECSLYPDENLVLYPVTFENGSAELDPDYSGNILEFRKENGSVALATEGVNEDDMVELLCDWAGGSMKSSELEAMWNTWKGWIYEGSWEGERLLVFPIDNSSINSVITLQLLIEDWYNMEYSRFYLGMMTD